jgi:hypothetical protein
MPIVPITDLTIKNDNLIAATQGRGFYLIDDLTPLHQLSTEVASSSVWLFKPMPSYRFGPTVGFGRTSLTAGTNHPGGVIVHFYVADTTKAQVSLEFMESGGKLIKKYSTRPNTRNREERMSLSQPGMNKFSWNMRYPDAERFDGMILWSGSMTGPMAVPGMYKVRLTVNGKSIESDFEILKDPRVSSSIADMQAQFDFLQSVVSKVSETHVAIRNIRSARDQINRVVEPARSQGDAMKALLDKAKSIQDGMTAIEEALYQTKNRSGQDPLNFPIRLNNKLAHLNSLANSGNFPPTEQMIGVRDELTVLIDAELAKLKSIFDTEIPAFNALVKELKMDAVILQKQ